MNKQIIMTSNLSCLYNAKQYSMIWILEKYFYWYYRDKKERISLLMQPNVLLIKELGISENLKTKLYESSKNAENISEHIIKKVLLSLDNSDARFRLNQLCCMRYDKPICICSSQSHKYSIQNFVGVLVHNTGLVNVMSNGYSIENTDLYKEYKDKIYLKKKEKEVT